MKYKLIVAAMELDGHAGGAAIVTNDPVVEKSFRDDLLLYEGKPTAELSHTCVEEGCLVEYFRGTDFAGDLTITTRECENVAELLNQCTEGRTG